MFIVIIVIAITITIINVSIFQPYMNQTQILNIVTFNHIYSHI